VATELEGGVGLTELECEEVVTELEEVGVVGEYAWVRKSVGSRSRAELAASTCDAFWD
jgi:hypothetical protein